MPSWGYCFLDWSGLKPMLLLIVSFSFFWMLQTGSALGVNKEQKE